MYIKELHYTNVGPISSLSLRFRRNQDNVPVPVVLVGQNGSGKSILLSNIVDAFYETADAYYSNASIRGSAGELHYYKLITDREIQVGKNFLAVYISFEQDSQEFSYIFKSGEITFEEYQKEIEHQIDTRLNWNDEYNHKGVTADNKIAQNVFGKDVVCYFGPDRYSRPFWMRKDYMRSDPLSQFSLLKRYEGKLNNPITAENLTEKTLQWLFDVIADSRADLTKKDEKSNNYNITFPSIGDLDLLSVARHNAEEIMSKILGEDVVFRMQNRSLGERRFSICRPDGSIVVNSLDALSTGQLALFQMFATIIRYADTNDIKLSYSLQNIRGVVVIDEIELHLHASLQREVLPRLIKLFPQVQFVITSHSPLFLLGMNEIIGEENYDIYEMPKGIKISAEQFSEFESAYRYFASTEHFRQEIAEAIERTQEKPLIITEGATDWKHMKAAYEALKNDPRCSEWLSQLDFEFFEYEPENSETSAEHKIEMGDSRLADLCEYYSMIPHNKNKKIFISDCDDPGKTKKLKGEGKNYKAWGNSVFSLWLPVPQHRKLTPDICIEHYYQDEEIRRTVKCNDGIERRIFMGNEFNEKGFSVAGGKKLYCECKGKCGSRKISIIDGSGKCKVSQPWTENSEKNYALPKMEFAERILRKEEPFTDVDFSAFIKLFEVIRDILKGEN